MRFIISFPVFRNTRTFACPCSGLSDRHERVRHLIFEDAGEANQNSLRMHVNVDARLRDRNWKARKLELYRGRKCRLA